MLFSCNTKKNYFLWKWTLVGCFYLLKTLMADHLRHISGAISLFSDAIPEIFDAVSRTRWSEPWLAPAQTNRRLQCSYWPPWWEVWLLAGHPRTLDVRTACKRAPGSAYQIISCRPSTLTCDGTSGDGGMFQTGANHKKSILFFSAWDCVKNTDDH